jgi:hypothetical protein
MLIEFCHVLLSHLTNLVQIRSDWFNLGQIRSSWIKLVQIGSNQIGSNQIWSIWIKLNQLGSNQIKLVQISSYCQNLGIGAWPPPLSFDYSETWLMLVMLEYIQNCFFKFFIHMIKINFLHAFDKLDKYKCVENGYRKLETSRNIKNNIFFYF